MDAAAPTVLLVDADATAQDGLSRLLAGEGYNIVIAPHAGAAIDAMRRARLNFIVLNAHLPAVERWALAAAYEQIPGPFPPLIFLEPGTASSGRAVLDLLDSYGDWSVQ